MIHDDRYNYSKVKYVNSHTKIIIMCPVHGEFKRTPNSHLGNHGCPMCSGNTKSTTEEFIEKAIKIHNNEYDYSKFSYKNAHTRGVIICKKHGEFKQSPNNHVSNKNGCPDCSNELLKLGLTCFIQKAKKIHDNEYDYSKFSYINTRTKSTIICKKHGEFNQNPHSHLKGKGCPKCNLSKGEKIISKWLKSNSINYKIEKSFDKCFVDKKNKKLRFDFYLPEHNTLIEFDGVHHFKAKYGEDVFNKQLLRDRIKDQYCINNNINLIRIGFWENINEMLEGWNKVDNCCSKWDN